eukprot:CAMPEP_0180625428 /NCGR_PEP_ID=MMETSP1037_2-20121125/37313_1 /TAXON_ID=632150 /ORGANISM="Azadinium spinosum, Strain 3D9" /LENGTH=572 /DNA_ID=CAMNT_0022645943 /DNA_START=35 /DNA_END=1750 /DNA_ORIENTATION=+
MGAGGAEELRALLRTGILLLLTQAHANSNAVVAGHDQQPQNVGARGLQLRSAVGAVQVRPRMLRTNSSSSPMCGLQAAPPVIGQLGEHTWHSDARGEESAWEFVMAADCTYGLLESSDELQCLAGKWLILSGASQTNIWTTQFANTLSPDSLVTKRDGYSIDGWATIMIDLIIDSRTQKVVYKNVIRDERAAHNLRRGAHTVERDRVELTRQFAQVHSGPAPDSAFSDYILPAYSRHLIRITNFFAQYWDNIAPALDAVEAAHAWDSAPLLGIFSIGLWYSNSFRCNGLDPHSWCGTRPAYGDLTLDELIDQFVDDMDAAMPKLSQFCSASGRAKELGCNMASIDHCPKMQGAIWHKIYDPVGKAMHARWGHKGFRFIDLWTLTMEIPENCIGGHQSPMSTIWTWQVYLAGICKPPPSQTQELVLAQFEGPTCRSAMVEKACPNNGHAEGFHFGWECALSKPCVMSRVIPPATVRPIQMAKGVVLVDLDKASKVTRQVPKTPPHSVLAPFPAFMQGHEEFWFVVIAIALALMMYLTDKRVFGGPGFLETLSTEWNDFFKELREECCCPCAAK